MAKKNWVLLGVIALICLTWGIGYWLYLAN